MCFYKTGNFKAIKPLLRTFLQVATPSVCSNLPQCEESWNLLNFKTVNWQCVFGTHKRDEQKD